MGREVGEAYIWIGCLSACPFDIVIIVGVLVVFVAAASRNEGSDDAGEEKDDEERRGGGHDHLMHKSINPMHVCVEVD